ncbi:MAG: hypothetical protein U9P07_09745 [Pseudomonadota bacterium]|nr:hypothetical protein [Pseudomonadota bacterium]
MVDNLDMTTAKKQKHPCADCRFCQWCGDDRCRICRGECADGRGCRIRKLSFAEQIEAYEKLNQQKRK